MNNLTRSLMISGAILGLSIPVVSAQEESGAVHGGYITVDGVPGNGSDEGRGKEMLDKYDEAYDKGGFDRLSGTDEFITHDDYLANMNGKEDGKFSDARWNQAMKFDADGDGQLSQAEARSYRDAERKKLIQNKDALKQMGDHPDWVKKHPDVAKEVLKNREFLNDHPVVADKLTQDSDWLAKHPDAAKEIYENREFLNKNPKVAERLYGDRKFLDNHPDAARALYQDKEFLKQHPKFSNDAEKYFSKHPEAARAAAKHDRAFTKGVDAAQKHPGAANKVYKQGREHPEAAKKGVRAAGKHPQASEKAYRAGKSRPGAVNRAKAHPGAAQKASRNPGKAKAAGKARRGR